MWLTLKRQNLHIIGIEVEEDSLINGIDQNFSRIIAITEENFAKLRIDTPI